jgi:hypothetical protein
LRIGDGDLSPIRICGISYERRRARKPQAVEITQRLDNKSFES